MFTHLEMPNSETADVATACGAGDKYKVCELLKYEDDHTLMRGSMKDGWFDNLRRNGSFKL